ncbi:MAG: tetratricopeptide repeat protein [Chloroflexota bacterium]
MSQNIPLFDEIWNYSQPKETAVEFRKLLQEPHIQNDLNAKLQLLTQLARTQGLQRKFDEAHAILNEVEPRLNDALTVAKIRYALERGRTFNSNKQTELARPLFLQAYELSQANGEDFYTIDAAHMMGVLDGDLEAQMAWNLIAMEAAKKTTSARARRWIGSLSNNIGWTYHDQGKYEEALAMFEQTQAFFIDEIPNAGRERIARWCIGKMYRLLNRLDESLDVQKQLERAYAELEDDDGYVQEELGETLFAMGQKYKAIPHFAKAYYILSQDDWLIANESERLERLKKSGNIEDN